MSTDQIRFYLSFLLVSSSIFWSCVSYDAPVIYHKNFQPGTHDSLRFDGYYYLGNERGYAPMFLYRDGSVWYGEKRYQLNFLETELAKKNPSIPHSWGNYKIDNDTILVERFKKIESANNFRRISIKGIIRGGMINWILYEENRLNPDTVNYNSIFKAFSPKPDSTLNWTRTHPPYNK